MEEINKFLEFQKLLELYLNCDENFPSLGKLMSSFQISKSDARKATEFFLKQDLIYSKERIGYYVNVEKKELFFGNINLCQRVIISISLHILIIKTIWKHTDNF